MWSSMQQTLERGNLQKIVSLDPAIPVSVQYISGSQDLRMPFVFYKGTKQSVPIMLF